MILSKLLGPVFVSSLLPLCGATAVMLDPAVVQAAEVKGASCEVHAVLALKDGDGSIPANLSFLKEQLRNDKFAAFKSFRLLETKSLELKLGETGGASMRTGHQLKLRLLGAEASKLQFHALLSSADKVLVETDYRIESNGILLIGGVRHPEGKVFFAIRCRGS